MGGAGFMLIQWDPLTLAIAVGIVAGGLIVAERYDDIAQDAMDMAEDIATRIFDIEADITDHWMTNQYPQTLAVIDEIYGYEPPEADYGGAVYDGVRYGEALQADIQTGIDVTQDRYRFCTDSGCNKELDIYMAAAEVDFAQQVMRHQERRGERQTQTHIEFTSRAYRASRESPDDIFSLMRNAQNTYGNIYNAASQSADGAIGLIGAGIGTFIGGFFNT